jgi:hypothetical protein
MRTTGWIGLVIIIIIIGGAVWYFSTPAGTQQASTGGTAGAHCGGNIMNAPTCAAGYHCQLAVNRPDTGGTCVADTATTTPQTTTTPQGVTFSFPDAFALATGNEPIMVHSYIPPCDQGYDYCIYKNDTEFAGTNFESAGLAITAKPALTTQAACLNTPPQGYDSSLKPSKTASGTGYSASVFAKLGNAAAGHNALDNIYRLYQSGTGACTEIDERVGQSVYGNYPAGTIQEFTAADQAQAFSELGSILSGMTLGGSPITWPS